MKGSASIETLLIILVAIYIAAVVYKGVVVAGFAFAKDEYRIATAKLAADKIANIAQMLKASAPGTPKTVEIFVPEETRLYCASGSAYIRIEVNTERTYNNAVCTGTVCTGQVLLGLTCDSDWDVLGPIRKKVTIVKIGADKVRIGEPV